VIYRSAVTFPEKLPGVSRRAIFPSIVGLSSEEIRVKSPLPPEPSALKLGEVPTRVKVPVKLCVVSISTFVVPVTSISLK